MINIDRLPIDITNHIVNFRNFLIASWSSLDDLMMQHDWENDGDFIQDWLQVNWEFLVERELLEKKEFLTQFSLTNLSCRITYTDAIPNYIVIANSDKILKDVKTCKVVPFENCLRLYFFSTFRDFGYGVYPPFDLADLVNDKTNERFIVPIKELKFYLDRIKGC